ncbi:PKD domain-containing protein [Mesoflavibacter profundi]|uniref:PKD domain-containing protein n=1 Tax=Mesoflavibacter profundi TaxID=2708110 RepID=UPI003512CA5A
MNYYVNIIDTENSNYTTQLEYASADSIRLKWKGADAVDDLSIVGSVLYFNLEVPFNNNVDAAFIDLFTGDEQRYKVEFRRETDDFLIWQGFLLPDSYNEPYTNGTFYVDFEAVDGLGRLKGKYLPEDFYTTEKSVVEIVCKCLELTGLQMDLIFAPGIDNKVEKDWSKIYLHGSMFTDKDKQQDAYKVLQTIVEDTISCVYQKLGVWYFEGLNKRNLLSYEAYKYNFDGSFVNIENIQKVVRDIVGKTLQTPRVDVITPYNKIAITHEREKLGFKPTVSKEENDGWVVGAAVLGEVYATEWYGYGIFFAKAKAPDYNIYLKLSGYSDFEPSKYIELLNKIYIKKNQKLKFSLEFSLKYYGTEDSALIDVMIGNGDWKDFVKYELLLADQILFSNNQSSFSSAESISFSSDKKASVSFEFLAAQSGLLNVKIYEPFGISDLIKVEGVFIDAITIEDIESVDEIIVEDILSAEYTIDKDLTLKIADDVAGINNAFRLSKLEQSNPFSFTNIEVQVLYGFTQNGNNYSQVALSGANLINDNITSVYYNNTLLTDLEVFYNYQNGEQMLVKTNTLITSGNFVVRVHKKIDYNLDRLHWETWTDSVYQIESKRYCNAVLGVYRRLFSDVSQKIDLTVEKTPVMFGDIIKWNYIENRNYTILDSEVNFDSGDSTIRIQNATYIIDTGNVPPIVETETTLYLYDTDSVVELIATAYDPDGTVVSYFWEQISGPTASVSIATPNVQSTFVSGLTGSNYQFQITVTDNDGLTATSIVNVVRVVNYNFSFSQVSFEQIQADNHQERITKFDLNIDPNLPDNESVTLSCLGFLENFLNNDPVSAFSEFKVIKNGLTIISHLEDGQFSNTFSSTFNFINTDSIQISLKVSVFTVFSGAGSAYARFTVSSANFYNYLSTSNLPIDVDSYVQIQ